MAPGVYFYNADAKTYTNIGDITGSAGIVDFHVSFWGSNTNDRAIFYQFESGNTIVHNLDLPTATVVDSVNVANPTANTPTASSSITLASGKHLATYASTNGANVFICATTDSLNATSVIHTTAANVSAVGGLTNALAHTICAFETSGGNGHVLMSYSSENTQPMTVMANFYNADTSLVINSVTNFHYSLMPAAGVRYLNSVAYVPMVYQRGGWWRSSPTDADYATSQGSVVLFASTGLYTSGNQFVPVAAIDDLAWPRIVAYEGPSIHGWSGNSIVLGVPSGRQETSTSTWSANYGFGETRLYEYTINTSVQNIRPVEASSQICIPSCWPRVFDGTSIVPMGPPEYPEGLVVSQTNSASGNFDAAGGVGQYYYAATFSARDGRGREITSAASPSVGVDLDNSAAYVSCVIPYPPLLALSLGPHASFKSEFYRTSADGNDFFRVGTGTNSFTDYGKLAFTAESGLDSLLTAKALYTQNGELESVGAPPHRVGCVHSGRYFYVPRYTEDSVIRYSKSMEQPFSSFAFNEILEFAVNPAGGATRHLSSHNEKLYIGKERAWLVTYGEPLNDAGVGQGFAAPRIITQEAGVKYPTAAAEGTVGIVFVNSVDGGIYIIGNDESVQYIGAPVRYYTDTYAYDNVWFAPQDSCVRISSATVGAPTLSFNYKYNRWSTFTGRYDDGIRAAFAAPVGPSNAYVDVVMDVNGNVYVQDPVGTNATAESFNVNISTSWISLGDILGYGKFYKWTLIGSKKGSALNLNLKTAYDYEPYWTDSQSYNASALTNFSIDTHYGTMASNAVVDQALKIQVDGSRHKTDAIRLCISENNGTARDTIELLGARLEIGVRPGSTRLGSGRTVS